MNAWDFLIDLGRGMIAGAVLSLVILAPFLAPQIVGELLGAAAVLAIAAMWVYRDELVGDEYEPAEAKDTP